MTIKGKWNFGPLYEAGDDGVELYADSLSPTTVRKIRAELELTQQGLATMLGVSLRTIKAWEHPNRDNSEARNCVGAGRKLLILISLHGDVVERLKEVD